MKAVHILLIAILLDPQPTAFSQDHASPCRPTEAFRLQDGTPVKMRTTQNISSADAKVDDRVDFEVLEEVSVCNIVVIPKGATAWGTVTEAQSKRRMGRGGKLDVTIEAVRLASGEKAALKAVKGGEGGGSSAKMTAGIVATSLIVWPAAPFFLFMKGKDITIPKGAEITAYVRGDANLDPVKFHMGTTAAANPAPIAPATASAPAAGAAGQSIAVAIASTPEGAEITVNGKYMGSTPSTLRLPPGDHAISITKQGFKPWQRVMGITAGSDVAIDAILEKN